jgi:RNA polymerase sigma-70 factor (ECF subfamily)
MDPSKFDALFREHSSGLYAFLLYRTGDPALAEDVVGDTFERALRARARFRRSRASEKTWLYAIALNRLTDIQRRSGAESRAMTKVARSEPATDPARQVLADMELQRALATLPPAERDVIALRFGGELTVPEIAATLNEPLRRVEGRLYRGLSRLRTTLGERDAG